MGVYIKRIWPSDAASNILEEWRYMKKNVLVVDDEIGALTLIGIMLERGGFNVLKAKDA